MLRHQYPIALAQRFVREYESILPNFSAVENIELTDHLLKALGQLNDFAATGDDECYQQYAQSEDALLRKYGKRFKPFADAAFRKYFYFDTVLAEKEIISSGTFNAMEPGTQNLTELEVAQFTKLCTNALSYQRQLLYLQDDTAATSSPEALDSAYTQVDQPDKEATKARQLLAMYYLLKASFNIEGRESSSVSGIAKFIHLLTGTRFTTLQNSDIYKKYLQMPNYKKGSLLIADLQYIRPLFEELGLDNAVQLINDELARATRDLPYGERTKHASQ